MGYHPIPRDVAASAASLGVIGVGTADSDRVVLRFDGEDRPIAEWQTTCGGRSRRRGTRQRGEGGS